MPRRRDASANVGRPSAGVEACAPEGAREPHDEAERDRPEPKRPDRWIVLAPLSLATADS